MINYATYQFYTYTYKGTISESLFNSLIPKVSREIDKVVNRELTEADIDEKVQFVACQLTDFFNNNNIGNNLSSVSIDGVSKTYKTSSESKQDMINILDSLPHELTRFL